MELEIPRGGACSFCDDMSGQRECALVVRNDVVAAQINERQYERGAMLIIPVRHRESILDITDVELIEVYRLARRAAESVLLAFGASGVNIFQNNGSAAGQSEAHFHVHVVPRYSTSDPKKRFERADFEITPMAEQLAVAAAIREAMGLRGGVGWSRTV